MSMSLFLLASHVLGAASAIASAPAQDPPVRVWFNSSGNYALGDRAKVYAKSATDAASHALFALATTLRMAAPRR